ncbi:hypothetical protein ES703_11402 [subsurface metagenome]
MHKTGICHFRVGLIDGVSLEIGKWETVLEEMGHKVYLLAGETSSLDVTIIPELHLGHPEIRKIYYNAFYSLSDFPSEEKFSKEIFRIAELIEEKISSFIK